jgi:mercuric ion transport protein
MNAPAERISISAICVAVVAALGASICCVVPLVLVLLGISGAWISHLTALDAWRPWLSGVTLVCLGLAAWTLYGPASRCRTDGKCIERGVTRRRRVWLWLATILAGLLLLFPYYGTWFL